MKLRGILPTHVTDEEVVLCKAAHAIRNAYEIRLALFMAVNSGRTFVLTVSPYAIVNDALEKNVLQHGGKIVRTTIRDHSVYIGAVDGNGDELYGWVAGDNDAWEKVLAGIRSPWLKDRLHVGSTIATAEFPDFRDTINRETIRATNIDDEDVQQALLQLIRDAAHAGGSIFVQ